MCEREREREYLNGSRCMTPQGMMDGWICQASCIYRVVILFLPLCTAITHIYILEEGEGEGEECYADNAKMNDNYPTSYSALAC